MNKKQLISEISKKNNINSILVEKICDNIFDEILNVLQYDKVILSSFGTFETVETKGRKIKSINDGKYIQIPAGKKIKFTASKSLKK